MWIFKSKKTKEKEKRIFEAESRIAQSIISAVCKELPTEYGYLSRQFDEGLITGADAQMAQSYKKGYRNIVHNVGLLNKYEDKKGREFIIDNVYISNFDRSKDYKITIEIAYGLFMGYVIDIDRDVIESLDVNSINAKGLEIKYTNNPLEKLFTKAELKYLNPSDVYEVDLFEKGVYYHLFDLEDGDFIGMDARKKVYEITHDPYEITLVEDTLLTYLKKREQAGD